MKGEDFITLAGFLAALRQHPVYEACCRSAVSRAYYGAYHISKAFLEEMGLIVGEAHPDLAEDFAGAHLEDSQLVGSLLDQLRKHRNKADYELQGSTAFGSRSAEYAVEVAGQVINHLQKLRTLLEADDAKHQLRSAIATSRAMRRVKNR